MTVQDQTPSGTGQGGDGISTKEEMVSKKELDRVLNDMHRFKEQAKKASEVENELQEIKKAREEQETKRMKESNEYKALAEKLEKENNEWRDKHKKLNDSLFTTQKFNELRAAAIREGIIDEKDLESLSLDSLSVEYTSNGRIIVGGA